MMIDETGRAVPVPGTQPKGDSAWMRYRLAMGNHDQALRARAMSEARRVVELSLRNERGAPDPSKLGISDPTQAQQVLEEIVRAKADQIYHDYTKPDQPYKAGPNILGGMSPDAQKLYGHRALGLPEPPTPPQQPSFFGDLMGKVGRYFGMGGTPQPSFGQRLQMTAPGAPPAPPQMPTGGDADVNSILQSQGIK